MVGVRPESARTKGTHRGPATAATPHPVLPATSGPPRWPTACTCRSRPWPAGPRRASCPSEDACWSPAPPGGGDRPAGRRAAGAADGLAQSDSSRLVVQPIALSVLARLISNGWSGLERRATEGRKDRNRVWVHAVAGRRWLAGPLQLAAVPRARRPGPPASPLL